VDNTNIILLLDKIQKGYKGLAYSYKLAFERLNYQCEVISFNINKKVMSGTKFVPLLRAGILANKQQEVLKEVARSQARWVFVLKGIYLLPETVDAIKNMGKTIFCFNPDDPFSEIFGASNNNIKECVSHYNAYFIWSRKLVGALGDAGAKNVSYLPFAADTDLFKPEKNGINKPYALGFIGNSDNERMQFIVSLSEKLKNWNEKKVLYGHGWKKITGFECHKPVFGNDFLNAIYQTRIHLNLLRNQNKGSHNMRTFEIPAAGGFMLHEYSEEAVNFFVEGKEAEFYRDAEECANKIKYYSNHENERMKIAINGYEKIHSAGYTYDKRIEKVITELQKLS